MSRPEDFEYYEMQNGGGRIPRVFVGAPYQRGHGIGSFLGGLFRRVLPYLSKGVRAVGKEALRAGINVMEDVENNTPFKEAVKSRLKESSRNLKRKAKEKITKLMTGTGYKVSAKTAALQFPFFGHESHIAARKHRRPHRRQMSKKKSPKNSSVVRKRSNKKKTTKKKKIRSAGRKTSNKKLSLTARRRRVKKRTVSDIFS